jgi:RHS repeat-associated protein
MHTNVYFAGKLIWAEGAAAVSDRLHSVVSGNRTYFPYGEEPTTSAQDKTKFATYYRDNTTALDYAQQRFYGRTIGRFTTPDPYVSTTRSADPQGWNPYAYVQNSPATFIDPEGQDFITPDFIWIEGKWTCWLTIVKPTEKTKAAVEFVCMGPSPHGPKGEEDFPCHPYWLPGDLVIEGLNGQRFTGSEINFAARAVFAEASGSLQVGASESTKEMYAIASVIYNRLDNPGFGALPTLSEVLRAEDQFQAVTGTHTQTRKFRSSDSFHSARLSPENCDDLNRALHAMLSVVINGPTNSYTFFKKAGPGSQGRRIGGSVFWGP